MSSESIFVFEIWSSLMSTPPDPSPPPLMWRIDQNGGNPVSIFRLTLKTCPYYGQTGGRHGFQKLRTLRHPYVLACLDSAELETEIVLATGTFDVTGVVCPWATEPPPPSSSQLINRNYSVDGRLCKMLGLCMNEARTIEIGKSNLCGLCGQPLWLM